MLRQGKAKRNNQIGEPAPALASSAVPEESSSSLGFYLLCLQLTLSLLSLPTRIPFLGATHPTILIFGALLFLALREVSQTKRNLRSPATTVLFAFLIYVFLSLPFVYWPGSVVKNNLSIFVSSFSYFFFIPVFIDNRRRLSIFVGIYIIAQVFRVYHPLFLHLTEGYWGDRTYLGDDVGFIPRLSGGPGDLINSNGLAAIVVLTVPFIYFWGRSQSNRLMRYLCFPIIAALIYALILTLSRSALLALLIEIVIFSLMSKYRVVVLSTMVVALAVSTLALSTLQLERFTSIYKSDVHGAETAHGRVSGIYRELDLILERPIFGYGLGTSFEAISNLRGGTTRSHTLYTEVPLETGIIGFLLFMIFLYKLWQMTVEIRTFNKNDDPNRPAIFQWFPNAFYVWLIAYLAFSIASYGLSNYIWYVHGGLIVACHKMINPTSSRQRLTKKFRSVY